MGSKDYGPYEVRVYRHGGMCCFTCYAQRTDDGFELTEVYAITGTPVAGEGCEPWNVLDYLATKIRAFIWDECADKAAADDREAKL